jgi:branched-chain amino acid transport system permease protein
MTDFFGIPIQALFGQILLGLINGSFYAVLSLGLAIIFGLLNIINFAHGAQYMLGAFLAWMGLSYLGVNYWAALLVAPLLVGLFGIVIQQVFLARLANVDHLYGFLMTYGIALVVQGLFRNSYGSSAVPYPVPAALRGGYDLGFMFLPSYRAWVVVISIAICLGVWLLIEKTRLGSHLRAATENPSLTRAFGINVPLLVTVTYGTGAALAAVAGVLAAPIYSVTPQMGADLIIVVFGVVVIGGMGSILGAVLTGFGLGLIEGLTKLFYPPASDVVIFIIMIVVLLIRPAGLFGTGAPSSDSAITLPHSANAGSEWSRYRPIFLVLAILLVIAPFLAYRVFLMQVLCFALFGVSFNMLLGYGGLLSFGHAAFFGIASYTCAHAAKQWGLSPELAILLGTLSAAVLGAVFGAIAIRRQGIYFAMITLALAQLLYFLSMQAPEITGGENGIQAVPRGTMFGVLDLSDDRVLYGVVAVIFMAGLLFYYRVIHSPFGQICKAIRDNEPRATSLGYRTRHYQVLLFTLSAGLAGLAGATKAIVFQLASLTDVHWSTSGEVVLITLVGGLGTMFGPVVGALIVVSMQNYLASFGAWTTVTQGAIFIVCVSLMREGIVGLAQKWTGRDL